MSISARLNFMSDSDYDIFMYFIHHIEGFFFLFIDHLMNFSLEKFPTE